MLCTLALCVVRCALCVVRCDVAVRLGFVFTALVVTEPPEHINIVREGSVLLEIALLLRLVLAPKLSASMPSYADAMHVGCIDVEKYWLLDAAHQLA